MLLKQAIRVGGLLLCGMGLSMSNAALADEAVATSGGVKVVSEDGNFWGKVGGLFQWDFYTNDIDDDSGFGSGLDGAGADYGTNFRRAEIILVGKLYDWTYLYVNDFSADGGNHFTEAWIAHAVGKYGRLYVGQRKPWRSFDELTSPSKTLTVERNLLSSNGINGSRFYGQGFFYKAVVPTAQGSFWGGASIYSLGNSLERNQKNEGFGLNGRVAYAPMVTDTQWTHLGLSVSSEIGEKNRNLWSRVSTYLTNAGSSIKIADFGPQSDDDETPKSERDTLQLELAHAQGPLLAKLEYGQASYSEEGRKDEDVTALAVEASWMLTGETHPYRKAYASKGGLTPKGADGAWEVVAGYNRIENDDVTVENSGSCRPSGATAANVDKCVASYAYLAANYYANKAFRVALQYSQGTLDLGTAGKDEPSSLVLRTQLAW